jgi:gliding motility-associated-like protein
MVFLLLLGNPLGLLAEGGFSPELLRKDTCCANVHGFVEEQSLINTFYPPKEDQKLEKGATSIVLDAVPVQDVFGNSYGDSPIVAGDLILIIQIQGASFDPSNTNSYGEGVANAGPDGLGATGFSAIGNTGNFEYFIAGNDVPLTGGILEINTLCGGGLQNSYENRLSTPDSVIKRFQIIKVARFGNLKLQRDIFTTAWNGQVGGVIALEVSGELDLNGFSIDASGKGFRGGFQNVRPSGNNNNVITTTNIALSSGKGEGISGTPRFMWNGINAVDYGPTWVGYMGGVYGRGAPGNAGGGGNIHNAGGGGGGNGGAGGVGGNGYAGSGGSGFFPNGGRPGNRIPQYTHRLFLGGGGGGGDANNATTGVKGGPGGGLILIQAANIVGEGRIVSNGIQGDRGIFGSAPDGAGGGGSGGTIYTMVKENSLSSSLRIEAKGGNGGNTVNDLGLPHGPGGGGGGGLVIHNLEQGVATFALDGGSNGFTDNGNGIAHGAAPGQPGKLFNYREEGILPDFTITLYPNPLAQFETSDICLGELFKPTNTSEVIDFLNSHIVVYQWEFGDGKTSSEPHPEHLYETAGQYKVRLQVSTNYGCVGTYEQIVNVWDIQIPVFAEVGPICEGTPLDPLPTISENGFSGTWTPPIDNSSTTTYTFVPDSGYCILPAILTIEILNKKAPPKGNSLQYFCPDPAPTLEDIEIEEENVFWYFSATGDSLVQNTSLLTSGATYYASQSNHGCNEEERLPVTVWINDFELTATDTFVCKGSSTTLEVKANDFCGGLPVNLKEGLVAYLPFCGNARDESGNENNGTVYGAALTSDRFGNLDRAYAFESNSSIITKYNVPEVKNTFTYSAWVLANNTLRIPPKGQRWNQATNFRDNHCALHPIHGVTFGNHTENAGSGLYVGTNGLYVVEHSDNWEAVPIRWEGELSGWHFITLVYESKIPKLYIDGIYIDSGIPSQRDIFLPLGPDFYSNYRRSGIGAGYRPPGSTAQFFSGKIDDLSFYQRALNPQEIQQLHQVGQATFKWSTGDTTEVIHPVPLETTKFWVDVTQNGFTCRKYITIHVNPGDIPEFAEVGPICEGTPLDPLPTISENGFSGTWTPPIDNSSTTTYTFVPQEGECVDSTHMTILVHSPSEALEEITVCDSLEWNGVVYRESGTYDFKTLNSWGCDSLVRLHLTLNNSSLSQQAEVACGSYAWEGFILLESGMYESRYSTDQGCDSLLVLDLTLHPEWEIEESWGVCDSVYWEGQWIRESGLYMEIYQTQWGCDSLVTLEIEVGSSVEREEWVSAISSYTWPVNYENYATSGRYEARFEGVDGCDSLVILNLEIRAPDAIWLPNVFYPWGDGMNNRFYVFASEGVERIERLMIFDRWGALVYEGRNFAPNSPEYGWDGTLKGEPVNVGVYVYTVEWIDSLGKRRRKNGDVTLLR